MPKTIRLQNWDYRNNGWYFVTICTRDRVCHFGDIVSREMELSPIGKIAQQCWLEIPQHSEFTSLDAYVVMPNHIHGIVIIDRCDSNAVDKRRDVNAIDERRDVVYNVPTANPVENVSRIMSELSPKTGSLSAIVRSYKAAVTRCCKQNGYNNFAWQPRFYETIVRTEDALEKIQNYIVNNPANWQDSKDNPINFEM